MEFKSKNKNKMKKRDQKSSDKQEKRQHVMKVVKKDLLNA